MKLFVWILLLFPLGPLATSCHYYYYYYYYYYYCYYYYYYCYYYYCYYYYFYYSNILIQGAGWEYVMMVALPSTR